MPKTNGVTEKQLKILRFIEQEIEKRGSAPTYRAIAQYFNLSAIGTVQDHISKLIDHGFLEKPLGQKRGIKLPVQTQISWIPILGSVPAGRPLEAIEEREGSLALAGKWKGELFALRVKGDSMKDRGILNGDYVIVKKQMDAEDGEIVVATVDHEATVKILKKKAGKIKLLPANPDFKPIEFSTDRENAIIGKVMAVHRHYS